MGGKQTPDDRPQPLTAAAVRSVARALEGILAEIQGGKSFQRTRMTRVKRLCRDQVAAEAFARFIAGRSLVKLEGRKRPSSVPAERWEHLTVLARDAMARLEKFLADRSPEAERALQEHRSALYHAQSEHQHIPYGAVRLIVCWEALQVEQALDCVLAGQPEARERYGYELASDYVRRSNFSGSRDLNKESAEPLAEIVAFWYGYADSLAAAQAANPARRGKERQ